MEGVIQPAGAAGISPTATPASRNTRRRHRWPSQQSADRPAHGFTTEENGSDARANVPQSQRPHRPRRSQERQRNETLTRFGSVEGLRSRGGHVAPGDRSSTPEDSSGGQGGSRQRREPHFEGQSQHGRQQVRQRFGGRLTSTSEDPSAERPPKHESQRSSRPAERPHPATSEASDLTTHLTNLLKTPPYPDCPICYSAVHPMQPSWSCSQTSASSALECCWTTFHLKCIKAWASKSVKETKDAYLARGEDHPGEWRCPNCQSKRTVVPSSYVCFCGSTPDPKPPRFATPHSCASSCTRARTTCQHPCPLQCHPGPCPPCAITLSISCYCSKEIKPVRCSHLHSSADNRPRSCRNTCGKQLKCGNKEHLCQDTCHPGDCAECPVTLVAACWCGAEKKTVKCGESDRFNCEGTCGRAYVCGHHKCEAKCHPHPEDDIHCPLDPSRARTCPCGKTVLTPGSRDKCTDPILTCASVCQKPFEGCDHLCPELCHTGPCPPCSVSITRRCRCGVTSAQTPCHLFSDSEPYICSAPCPSLRSCGRHQCTTRCCPAASVAKAKGKGRKKALNTGEGSWQDEIERMEREELERVWHTCEMVCGKMLGCGLHTCEERDHKGACPPCLRSSFDEMVCHCGKTVLIPPIPCGTRMSCPYTCSRPPPPCGHAKVPHSCHEDDVCPPCPYLTKKTCMCGKNEVANVRCSAEKVGCGVKCGKVLDCGFHHCERLCHSDECGGCNAVCGKDRKLCLPNHHPCTTSCHAPSACDESEPCRALITLSCQCGRIQQLAPCMRSASNGSSSSQAPLSPSTHSFSTLTREIKCTAECAIAQRNARLADALGISQQLRDKAPGRDVEWSAELRAFAKANAKFLDVVEKAFSDFIGSDKKTVVLPSMPETKRKFIHGLSELYRVNSQSVDQEPHRSVQLTRRLDSRIPHPLLSSVIHAPLGKLTDLRAPATPRSSTPPTTPALATARGWRSVVAASPNASPSWGPHSKDSGLSSRSNLSASTSQYATSVRVPEDWEEDA